MRNFQLFYWSCLSFFFGKTMKDENNGFNPHMNNDSVQIIGLLYPNFWVCPTESISNQA